MIAQSGQNFELPNLRIILNQELKTQSEKTGRTRLNHEKRTALIIWVLRTFKELFCNSAWKTGNQTAAAASCRTRKVKTYERGKNL